MPRILLLDTGPLGKLTHPRTGQDAYRKLLSQIASDYEPFVPDVCGYELRRELIRADLNSSERRLDELIAQFGMVSATPEVWRLAAGLWARARKAGRPTADRQSLDGDVILAAEAMAHEAAVLTMDLGDLGSLLGPGYVVDWHGV